MKTSCLEVSGLNLARVLESVAFGDAAIVDSSLCVLTGATMLVHAQDKILHTRPLGTDPGMAVRSMCDLVVH